MTVTFRAEDGQVIGRVSDTASASQRRRWTSYSMNSIAQTTQRQSPRTARGWAWRSSNRSSRAQVERLPSSLSWAAAPLFTYYFSSSECVHRRTPLSYRTRRPDESEDYREGSNGGVCSRRDGSVHGDRPAGQGPTGRGTRAVRVRPAHRSWSVAPRLQHDHFASQETPPATGGDAVHLPHGGSIRATPKLDALARK